MLELNGNLLSPQPQLSPPSPKLCPNRNSSSRPCLGMSAFRPKFHGLFLSRSSRRKKLAVKGRYSDFNEKQKFTSSRPSSSTDTSFASQSPGVGALQPRVYVSHAIYKGKAALAVDPRPPEFAPLSSGVFKIVKEGSVLLQFAPAAGVRQYDWSRKLVFLLSATEIGSLVSLGTRDSCEFFHDPNIGKSDEGKVRKVLRVEPLPDGSGHFFNLSVQNKVQNMDESIYIPVSKAEFAVLVSAFNYILPYLLGWHAFANSIIPNDANPGNTASAGYGGDHEWNRKQT